MLGHDVGARLVADGRLAVDVGVPSEGRKGRASSPLSGTRGILVHVPRGIGNVPAGGAVCLFGAACVLIPRQLQAVINTGRLGGSDYSRCRADRQGRRRGAASVRREDECRKRSRGTDEQRETAVVMNITENKNNSVQCY